MTDELTTMNREHMSRRFGTGPEGREVGIVSAVAGTKRCRMNRGARLIMDAIGCPGPFRFCETNPIGGLFVRGLSVKSLFQSCCARENNGVRVIHLAWSSIYRCQQVANATAVGRRTTS
jgi:hypothetical protein